MASSRIVVKDKSSSSALNHLDLVDVPLGVKVPVEAYSSLGRTRLVYAFDLTAALHSPSILLLKGLVTWRNFSPGWDFSPAVEC